MIRIHALNRRHFQAALLLAHRKSYPSWYEEKVRELKENGEEDILELLRHPERIQVIA